MKYGWRSRKAQRMFSTLFGYSSLPEPALTSGAVYRGEDGGEVVVTYVTDDPHHNTGWEDIEFVGMVTDFLRQAPPLSPSEIMADLQASVCPTCGHRANAAPC